MPRLAKQKEKKSVKPTKVSGGTSASYAAETDTNNPPKRKRGRPKKIQSQQTAPVSALPDKKHEATKSDYFLRYTHSLERTFAAAVRFRQRKEKLSAAYEEFQEKLYNFLNEVAEKSMCVLQRNYGDEKNLADLQDEITFSLSHSMDRITLTPRNPTLKINIAPRRSTIILTNVDFDTTKKDSVIQVKPDLYETLTEISQNVEIWLENLEPYYSNTSNKEETTTKETSEEEKIKKTEEEFEDEEEEEEFEDEEEEFEDEEEEEFEDEEDGYEDAYDVEEKTPPKLTQPPKKAKLEEFYNIPTAATNRIPPRLRDEPLTNEQITESSTANNGTYHQRNGLQPRPGYTTNAKTTKSYEEEIDNEDRILGSQGIGWEKPAVIETTKEQENESIMEEFYKHRPDRTLPKNVANKTWPATKEELEEFNLEFLKYLPKPQTMLKYPDKMGKDAWLIDKIKELQKNYTFEQIDALIRRYFAAEHARMQGYDLLALRYEQKDKINEYLDELYPEITGVKPRIPAEQKTRKTVTSGAQIPPQNGWEEADNIG